jgi:hypothetical protein
VIIQGIISLLFAFVIKIFSSKNDIRHPGYREWSRGVWKETLDVALDTLLNHRKLVGHS